MLTLSDKGLHPPPRIFIADFSKLFPKNLQKIGKNIQKLGEYTQKFCAPVSRELFFQNFSRYFFPNFSSAIPTEIPGHTPADEAMI